MVPDAWVDLGSATVSPDSGVSGEYGTWTVSYTVGEESSSVSSVVVLPILLIILAAIGVAFVYRRRLPDLASNGLRKLGLRRGV